MVTPLGSDAGSKIECADMMTMAISSSRSVFGSLREVERVTLRQRLGKEPALDSQSLTHVIRTY